MRTVSFYARVKKKWSPRNQENDNKKKKTGKKNK